jgi:hypothetical protein
MNRRAFAFTLCWLLGITLWSSQCWSEPSLTMDTVRIGGIGLGMTLDDALMTLGSTNRAVAGKRNCISPAGLDLSWKDVQIRVVNERVVYLEGNSVKIQDDVFDGTKRIFEIETALQRFSDLKISKWTSREYSAIERCYGLTGSPGGAKSWVAIEFFFNKQNGLLSQAAVSLRHAEALGVPWPSWEEIMFRDPFAISIDD